MSTRSYILGIDQSTQGTKAILFDETGILIARADRPHRQLIDARGYVEHDPEEIYRNTLSVARDVLDKAGVEPGAVLGIGISNQRETSLAWRPDGIPLCNAIVWQCGRAAQITETLAAEGQGEFVRSHSGIPLSPFFPAGKLAWILRNVPEAQSLAENGTLRLGTVDAYLVFRLTGGRVFRTDYSNASRTQLFDIQRLQWDETLCSLFGIPVAALPEVTDSDGDYGETDLEGLLPHPVPIRGVLGDSHAALFGQGCLLPGMGKATYGTGSSVMVNVGHAPVFSTHGVVTSLAWSMGGQVDYVLEGNINYTGAVITWLKEDLGLIADPAETETLAKAASPEDQTYRVPAFTGLGALYWDNEARGMFVGLSRTTKRAELVRAALDCIVYQITDILRAMNEDMSVTGTPSIRELRADGGPTRNSYLMQFQSDMARIPILVSRTEELSAMGAAYAAGLAVGLYDRQLLFHQTKQQTYMPEMPAEAASLRYTGWQAAVACCLTHGRNGS